MGTEEKANSQSKELIENGVPKPLGKESRNLAPELPRYSYRAWIRLDDGQNPSTDELNDCLREVAARSGGRIIVGPISVDAEGVTGIKQEYIDDIEFRDKQGMVWWTDENAPYVKGLPPFEAGKGTAAALEHSHGVIYYYPGSNLVDVCVETCMGFDPKPLDNYLAVRWHSTEGNMQRIFQQITTGSEIEIDPNVVQRMSQVYELIKKYSGSVFERAQILVDGERAEQILMNWDGLELGYLWDYLTGSQREILLNIYAHFEGQLEQNTAEQIINGKNTDEKSFPKYDRYETLTNKEIRDNDIEPNTGVTFVGGGWFPISAILYARHGANVRIFEREEGRANTARRVIEKLGLNKKIEVVVAEAQNEGALLANDVIILAAMAEPKKEILDALKGNVKEGNHVEVRTTNYFDPFYGAESAGGRDWLTVDNHLSVLPDYKRGQIIGYEIFHPKTDYDVARINNERYIINR